MVITQLILGQLLNETVEKITKNLKPKDVQVVQVKQDPDSFSVTILDDVTTTSQKWKNKDNPDLVFENELSKESILKEISITPDNSFKTKGKIMITVDDSLVFRTRSFTVFSKASESTVKINKTIEQDSKVKIFIISSDGTPVSISAQVTFGE